MKLSEKYRAIANLYAHLESRPSDCDRASCHCEVIDNGDGIEIRESLYQELIASAKGSNALADIETSGIQIYRCDERGYVDDIDLLPLLPDE